MVKDTRDKLINYLTEGLRICNGVCNGCPAKDPIIMTDEQLLNDASVRNSLEERRMYLKTTEISSEYICPLHLALGRMVKDYAVKNRSSYKDPLLTVAGNMIFDAVKIPDSLKFKKTVAFAIKYLDDSKEETPLVTETTKTVLNKKPIIIVPENRMTARAKKFFNY